MINRFIKEGGAGVHDEQGWSKEVEQGWSKEQNWSKAEAYFVVQVTGDLKL